MNLASGFCVCVLCGWLAAGAPVMSTSRGSCGAASLRRVSSAWVSTAQNAAYAPAARPVRRDIEIQIDETENALNAIQRSLNPQGQKTAAVIRTDITRAREGLRHDDLEGARTLSIKAHVLLVELCLEASRHSGQKARMLLVG